MLIQGQVGPQAVAAGDGTPLEPRMTRTGCLVVTELHGRYFEQMRVGRGFSAANQAAQAMSVGLATAYTGLLLYNPVGSNKILVPNKTKFAQSASPTTFAAVGLLAGFAATGGVTAQTVKLNIQSNQVGNTAVGAGIALSSATIVAPTYLAMLQDQNTTTAVVSPMLGTDLEGIFGILPGGFIGFAANTVITGFGFMSWEEVDLPL